MLFGWVFSLLIRLRGRRSSIKQVAIKAQGKARKDMSFQRMEGCRSGRTGRSRKPLYALRTVGSNPTPSANFKLLLLNNYFS